MAHSKDTVQWPRGRLNFSYGCLSMGVLNVTPDSFSDGGQFLDSAAAADRGVQMVDEGAAIIDVGGESTRPGSQSVTADDEISRVVPVISDLRRRISTPVSIDTHKHEVARAALDAGAAILLISEDLDELIQLSDRIMVLYEGRIMGMLDSDTAEPDQIGLLMAGQSAETAA